MTIDPRQLPNLDVHVPCDAATAATCLRPAIYRVIMHPPEHAGTAGATCGHHITLLCDPCLRALVTTIRHTLTTSPQPLACPVCDMRFRSVHDIVREVEKL